MTGNAGMSKKETSRRNALGTLLAAVGTVALLPVVSWKFVKGLPMRVRPERRAIPRRK